MNSSCLNFLQFCLEHPELKINDFSEADVRRFKLAGGNQKALDGINKMVALWEQAFLFKNQVPQKLWKGWDEWIEFHLQKSTS